MATTINEMIKLNRAEGYTFATAHYPEAMGNTAQIAFGGCALSMAINAGLCSVPSQNLLYTAHGLFLGPCLITEKLKLEVINIRATKSFRTVRVEARQLQKGAERTTFYITLDFQIAEQRAMQFNLTPRIVHPKPGDCLETEEYLQQGIEKGTHPEKLVAVYLKNFAMSRRLFLTRQCLESVSGQNLTGMLKTAKTTQDHLNLTDKSSAYWFKSRSSVTRQESYAAISFIMDAALAFLPVTFSNKFITDYGALSTLDCALRFHTSDFSCNDWLLHEQITECGNEGRTYSTGRVFKEDGTLVATMTQSSILRPKLLQLSNL